MIKQINTLYFSPTETTAKVVKAIASGVGSNVKEYNLTLPEQRNQELSFGENDVVIIGVPVYMGRVPVFLTDYFSKVKGNNTPAIFIGVYGNRDYDDVLLELKDTFEKNGFVGVAGGAFVGEHSYTTVVATDRPDEKDLKIAYEFGLKIKEKLTLNGEAQLSVRGSFPYKEIPVLPPMSPETDDQCTNCGVCAKNCPMGAISFDNFKAVDEKKCIHCCSCVKKCPVGAKSFKHEMFVKITQGLIDNFGAVRKEPELFS